MQALILGAQEYDVSKQPPVAVNRTTQVHTSFEQQTLYLSPASNPHQVFVNLNNSNARLDKNMFVPFGVVVGGGMGTFDKIYSGYGQLPDQDAIYARGYAYLSSSFPLLSYTTAGDAAPPPLSPLSLMLLQLTFSHRSLGRGRRCHLLPCMQQTHVCHHVCSGLP